MTSKVQQALPIIFVIGLFAGLALALFQINQSEKNATPETWSAFIYANGYNSGKYKKTDDFVNYEQCRAFALPESKRFDDAPWECGLRCTFDSMRQGFHCDSMSNE